MKNAVLAALFLLSAPCALFAQTNAPDQNNTTTRTTQDARTGVRVTTRSTPIVIAPAYTPTIAETEAEIARLEALLAVMQQNPQTVQDGSAGKVQQALDQQRAVLADLRRRQ